MPRRFQMLYTKHELEKLQKAKIALCGLGGYGSSLIDPLARYEIGELRLADPDYYEPSNMDRQCLSKFSTIGTKKVEVAAQLVADITKHTHILCFPEGINSENILKFCDGSNLVIDLCDRLSVRLLLHSMCNQLKIILINGGNSSWPSRKGLRVSTYHYDKRARWSTIEFEHKKWGISSSVWASFIQEISIGVINPSTLKNIDEENAIYRSKNPPSRFGGGKTMKWNDGGGYDPLKISALTTGIIESLVEVLIGRRPKHQVITKRTHD